MTDTDVITERKLNSAPEPGVAFLELGPGQCHFPLGGPKDPPLRFCGEPAPEGSPFCPQCQAIAYRRPDTRGFRVIAWLGRNA